MEINFPFASPYLCLVVGASGSGKTYLISKILMDYEKIFGHKFRKLVIVFKFFQPCYMELKRKYQDNVVLSNNLCDELFSDDFIGDTNKGCFFS